ncbi:N,N-dimethylformamidase beta subunit family domain-containing protein [Amycolatopsis sp. M39]|uniref:N,N-dimethylformamidase beta subunit family domain-containing protein n=1 Tax=Amycolatopsis sp. M39 TaxID=1825094 RepID=UPI0012FFAD77|nr:N,N-dimethylformamidase beta subunit family domain-containing protein [Amycolatopsis sp. M39]
MTSTGRPGGLWRHRGRPPQALCGVGFAAQGWGRSEPYSRSEAAADPEWAWVFEGVDEDPIGAYGEVMGGAAGDEIDRVDRALGTPPQAVILASSRGHSNFYQRAIEEIPMNLPEHGGGEQDPEVHADIVYFRTPGGGEVFSTGSIAWSGALLHNKTDNGVSRMTENIVRAFVARRSG